MPEIFEIRLGRTPMIAETAEDTLVGLAKALTGMKVDQLFPIVIKKKDVSQEWLDRVHEATPWTKWSQDEERVKEQIAGELLKAVQS